jgi:aminopeptidase-like protein
MSSLVERVTDAGQELHALIAELYPICRSITGDGLRETLRLIQHRVPLEITEVPTGTTVLDWTVPKEWNIRDAWIANSRGERVVDFRESNLHVVNYSSPVRARMTLAELRPRLHAIPDRPDWIPYRTSYYDASWGFCLSQRALDALPDDVYDVCIDSSLEAGHLTYGEYLIEGAGEEEVLFSCHCCHPSLANDNLSGIAVAVQLAQELTERAKELRYSYRFLFIPGTIGSITWLARNRDAVGRIRHGLVLSCLGDPGPMTYKRSRRGNALIDRAVAHVLGASGDAHEISDFVPYGYDERQYCSPGFNLPVGCLTRTPDGRYPEYHTSADDLSLVRPESLAHSLATCSQVLDILENEATYVNLSPCGEPQLGRRGLYRKSGGESLPEYEMALLWVLNFSDGTHSLLDIAERSRLRFAHVSRAADDLLASGLLRVHGGERDSQIGMH